jgi:hypothetical protein
MNVIKLLFTILSIGAIMLLILIVLFFLLILFIPTSIIAFAGKKGE